MSAGIRLRAGAVRGEMPERISPHGHPLGILCRNRRRRGGTAPALSSAAGRMPYEIVTPYSSAHRSTRGCRAKAGDYT